MKFPEMNTAKTHTLHIPSFTDGLDSEQNPHENNVGGLEECENLSPNGGLLKTRLGLDTTPEHVIKSLRYSRGYYHTYKSENFETEIEGERKFIVTETVEYDISTHVCLTHFINPDGTDWGNLQILFSRVSDDTFFIPQKIHFFKGESRSGTGLFALVGLVNCENYTQTESRIYELKKEPLAWEYVYSTYIPTVLINGRGNRYEFAKGTGQAFTGTPTKVEGLNVLNHSFFAYFSTDGYSSTFRLPFSGISNQEVIATLYHSVNSYVSWYIEENQTSADATVFGVKVTMNIDREKGIVYFTVPAGAYEIPLISDRNENNLRIMASVDCEYSLNDLAFSDCVATTDKSILISSGNTVFEANYNNPLYFPVDSMTHIGSKDNCVTALTHLNGKAFAFKENEIYSLDIKYGKKLSETSLLADSTAVFYTPDTLDPECITWETGCRKGTAFVNSISKLYWIAPDSKVHSISSAKKVSVEPYQPDLVRLLLTNPYSNIVGTAWDSKVIFICENRAILIDCKNKKHPKWFYWSFPEDIRFVGAYTQNGNPRFICYNPAHKLCFSAYLSEGDDRFLYICDLEPTVASAPITTYLRTKKLALGCDNVFKKVDFITLNLKGAGKVCENGRYTARFKESEKASPFKLIPGICETNTVDFSVCSQSPISLGSADIGYTELEL